MRFRWQGRAVVVLTLVWVLLWGRVDLVTVLSGVLVGYLVGVVFPLPPVRVVGRLRPFGLVRLLGRLLIDLTSASWRIAKAIWNPGTVLRPGVIRVDLTTRSDLVQVATAAMVSLVPGTLVVEAPRSTRRLYLHVFDLSNPGAADQERERALEAERLVLGAIGSDAEIRRSRGEA